MNFFRQQNINALRLFFILFNVLIISGCIDLTGTGRSFEKKAAHIKAQDSKKGPKSAGSSKQMAEVHTMLGGLGIFSVGMYQLRDATAEKFEVSSASSMWYNAGHVTRTIEDYYYSHTPHRPIILMGHSLGANEQIKVARNLNKRGIPVALLVTIDAVSQTIVPPNVKEALNMYKPGYVPMFSGLKLRAVNPNATHIENVNVAELKGTNVNHFTIDKNEVVQAMIMDKVKKVISDANKQQA